MIVLVGVVWLFVLFVGFDWCFSLFCYFLGVAFGGLRITIVGLFVWVVGIGGVILLSVLL